ncbi:MAG: response regulator [Chlorobi bacterium]|nr:response regulator [Chlorobiota bacterium]
MADKTNKYDILVIDDEAVIIEAVKRIATGEGFKVDSSLSAKEALGKLLETEYKLIITDIMMPEMDGFQLLEELEKRKLKIPVIVTTGYSTVEMAVKSLAKGAIGYIPKPFTLDELLSIIYRGLEFEKIDKKIAKEQFNVTDASIIYVPCPPKYYRLGYNSWINIDNEGSVFVGVSDMYLKTIKTLKSLTLRNFEDNIVQGAICATFEAEDGLIHHLLSPVSGMIIEPNDKLKEDITLIEKDPYFEGWLYRIIPSDLDFELKNLVSCSSDRI